MLNCAMRVYNIRKEKICVPCAFNQYWENKRMKTIKCNAILQENGKLVLEDLPIAKGKKVKVTLIIIDDQDDQLETMALDPNIQREI